MHAVTIDIVPVVPNGTTEPAPLHRPTTILTPRGVVAAQIVRIVGMLRDLIADQEPSLG